MRKSSHSAERLGHQAVFNRRTLGRATVSGRPLYGWSWACSCGKTGQHNGPLSTTLAYWKDHTTPAKPTRWLNTMTRAQRDLLCRLARPGFYAESRWSTSATVRDEGAGYAGVAFGPSLAKLEKLGYVTSMVTGALKTGFTETWDDHERRPCGADEWMITRTVAVNSSSSTTTVGRAPTSEGFPSYPSELAEGEAFVVELRPGVGIAEVFRQPVTPFGRRDEPPLRDVLRVYTLGVQQHYTPGFQTAKRAHMAAKKTIHFRKRGATTVGFFLVASDDGRNEAVTDRQGDNAFADVPSDKLVNATDNPIKARFGDPRT